MGITFTICYRGTSALRTTALIVEDEDGIAYLFDASGLQLYARGENAGERLVALLGGFERWRAVPRVAPYRLDALYRLLDAPPGHLLNGGKATYPDRHDFNEQPWYLAAPSCARMIGQG